MGLFERTDISTKELLMGSEDFQYYLRDIYGVDENGISVPPENIVVDNSLLEFQCTFGYQAVAVIDDPNFFKLCHSFGISDYKFHNEVYLNNIQQLDTNYGVSKIYSSFPIRFFKAAKNFTGIEFQSENRIVICGEFNKFRNCKFVAKQLEIRYISDSLSEIRNFINCDLDEVNNFIYTGPHRKLAHILRKIIYSIKFNDEIHTDIYSLLNYDGDLSKVEIGFLDPGPILGVRKSTIEPTNFCFHFLGGLVFKFECFENKKSVKLARENEYI